MMQPDLEARVSRLEDQVNRLLQTHALAEDAALRKTDLNRVVGYFGNSNRLEYNSSDS